MTTIKVGGLWSSLLTPSPEADVEAVVRGVKTWLLRTGGLLLVEEAERVGHMAVLSGREYLSGVRTCASVPLAEISARAA